MCFKIRKALMGYLYCLTRINYKRVEPVYKFDSFLPDSVCADPSYRFVSQDAERYNENINRIYHPDMLAFRSSIAGFGAHN